MSRNNQMSDQSFVAELQTRFRNDMERLGFRVSIKSREMELGRWGVFATVQSPGRHWFVGASYRLEAAQAGTYAESDKALAMDADLRGYVRRHLAEWLAEGVGLTP